MLYNSTQNTKNKESKDESDNSIKIINKFARYN